MGATTWDGLPVSPEKPYGASVAVWRERGSEREWLVLHRRHHGAEYEGEWAWTPPSGARLPGEPVEECARRELREEAGLELELTRVAAGRDDWAVYCAQAPEDAAIALDDEHDAFLWLPLDDAVARCLPEIVGATIGVAARSLPPR